MTFKKGQNYWKGRKHTDESKRKMSESKKGIMPKNVKLLGLYNKGKKRSSEFRQIISKTHKGKTVSLEVRKKISSKLKGISIEEWNGFSRTDSKSERMSKEYLAWRLKVFERDNFTCQDCGKERCYLEAHHIKSFAKFPELRFDLDNGKTLCLECHKFYKMKGGK